MGGIKGDVCFFVRMSPVLRCIFFLFERNIHETRVAKLLLLAEVLDFFRAIQHFCLEDLSDGFLDSWYLTVLLSRERREK